MDSTETFIAVSQLVLTLIIIPIIAIIRHYTKLFIVIDKAQFTALLLIGAMWGLSSWLMPEMTPAEIIERAFAMVGFSGVAYRTLVKKGGATTSLSGALNKFGRRTINQ